MLKDHTCLSLQDEASKVLNNTWDRLKLVVDLGFKGRANLQSPIEEGLKLATVISDLADSLRKQRPKDLPEKESQLYDKLLKRTQNLAADRKSTRLNSSHLVISYAVFCLKKTNKYTN